MKLDPQYRLVMATLFGVLSALLAGYFHVGSLYLLGLPLVPLAISLVILWTTKTSMMKRLGATLIVLLFIPAGFYIWIWWNDVTLIRTR